MDLISYGCTVYPQWKSFVEVIDDISDLVRALTFTIRSRGISMLVGQ